MGEWAFLPWLLGSTAVNYLVAIGIDRWRGQRRARLLLALGITVDLSLLLVFKYAGFFTENLNLVLALAQVGPLPVPSLALPLGISFFTFHKISYKIDVARGVAEVRRDPLDLLLYILLFPQLIAGPIVRYHDIAAELVERDHRLEEFASGVRRFVLGFGKKMLVANTVALCADRIFAIPVGQLSGGLAWLGIACYTIQIYADFSGYSDMAIGLARMFGFHFLENFDYPYVARSITDFWRRWHVSLSRWFRDYLYIPLGGNRVSPGRTYLNLVTVFFRAETLLQSFAFLRAMAGLGPAQGAEHTVARYLDRSMALALVAGVIASTPLLPAVAAAVGRRVSTAGGPRARLLVGGARAAALAGLLAVLLLGAMQMAGDTYNPFIYFRF